MLSQDFVELSLKSAILEYALKHRFDNIIKSFALKEERFHAYKISETRFSIYYIYVLVKDRRIDKFPNVINYLESFSMNFPTVLDDKLYFRVINALKTLYIYETLRDKPKEAFELLKEYFPRTKTYENISNKNKENDLRNSNDKSIARFRINVETCVLNEQKRINFFKNEYEKEFYNDKFFNFLLKKTRELVDNISQHMPLTKIEEIKETMFHNPNIILFNSNDELTHSDDVRLNLFLDILKFDKREFINDLYRFANNYSLEDSELIKSSLNQTSLARGILYLDSQVPDITRTYLTNDDVTTKANETTEFETALSNITDTRKMPLNYELIDLITDDEKENSP